MITGKYKQQVTKDTFSEWTRFLQGNVWIMGSVTKVSGSDHRGEIRIGWREQIKLQYTVGEVDMSANLQARQKPY